MSSLTIDRSRARAVKNELTARLRLNPKVNGVGLTRLGENWAVKVNVVSNASDIGLPSKIDGVEILIETVGPIVAS